MPKQKKQNADKPLSLQQAVKLEENFAYFDLSLSEAEKAALEKIRVGRAEDFNVFGDAAQLESQARKFFESLGNAPDVSAKAAQAVNRLAKEALSAFKAEAGWITVRATVPTDFYDMPRWHHDGYFYHPMEGDQYKAAMPLKGPSTLFSRFPEKLRSIFDELARPVGDKGPDREKLAELVAETPVESIPEGQGAVFVAGSNRGAIHSEPPMHTERLFMSVVPGTKEQIADMEGRFTKYENQKKSPVKIISPKS